MIDQLTRTGASLILDVTALIALAALAAAALRRSSAATRHFVWALALAGALALTLAVPFSPRFDVPVPWPAGAAPQTAALAIAPAASSAGLIAHAAHAPTPAAATRTSEPSTPSGAGLLALIWAAGALAMAARYALGHAGLVRLRRRSVPVVDADWLARLERTRRLLGVTQPVALAVSGDVGSPVTFGARRPIILLPAESEAWEPSLKLDVLRHELAHVARRDVLVQFVSQATSALHWWNPMAWLAARGALVESERACDDLVLAAGTPPPDYATHLIRVARGSRQLRLTTAVSIGMTRRSALEGRLLAVLDGASRRGAPSKRLRIAGGIALAFVLVPLAAVNFVPQARAAERIDEHDPAGSGDGTPIDRTLDAKEGERLVLELPTGGELVVKGWDRDGVQVRGRLTGRDWRRESVSVERTDGGVLVKTRWNGGSASFENRFVVLIPHRFDVHVESAGGGIRIVDVEGTLDGATGGGNVKLEHVKGRANLTTGGGEVVIQNCAVDGSVGTGGGKVRIEGNDGNLRGESGSDPVTRVNTGTLHNETTSIVESTIDSFVDDVVHSEIEGDVRRGTTVDGDDEGDEDEPDVDDDSGGAEATDGMIHVSRAGGDVHLAKASGGAVVTTGGGEIRIGAAAGKVRASTGGGDITIGPVAGSVGAETGAGDVEVTLVDAGGIPQIVEVSTGMGRVTVTLPSSFDGRLDLETARTENSSKSVRIDAPSEWIQHRESPETWDDRQGTPRRYVRAAGRAGRGRGLVKIRATNGDIEIRLGT